MTSSAPFAIFGWPDFLLNLLNNLLCVTTFMTQNFYRARVFDPACCVPGTERTKIIKDGLEAITCRVPHVKDIIFQAIRYNEDAYTVKPAPPGKFVEFWRNGAPSSFHAEYGKSYAKDGMDFMFTKYSTHECPK
jgi:hypothetical protein